MTDLKNANVAFFHLDSKVRKSGWPKLNPQPSSRNKQKKLNVPKQKQGTAQKNKKKKSTNLSLPLHPFSKKSNLKSLHLRPGIFSKKIAQFYTPLVFGEFLSERGGLSLIPLIFCSKVALIWPTIERLKSR